MGNQWIATFYYNNMNYDVYGCWDKHTKENEFDFYDVEERESGECINLGTPLYECPNLDDIISLVRTR